MPYAKTTLAEVDKKNLNKNIVDFDNYRNLEGIYQNQDENISSNILDFKFTSVYRDKIFKGYSGESEIYFGNSFTLSNYKSWVKSKSNTNLYLIYDFGYFKSKSKEENLLLNLYRNVFALKFNNKYKLWKKKELDKNINQEYKYIPFVIDQGIDWLTSVQSGIFLYSNGSYQEALSFSAGPKFTLGSFKNKPS